MATVEAVDAIQRALESEGVLQSIRAQLRASVFNIISKNTAGNKPTKSIKFLQEKQGMKFSSYFSHLNPDRTNNLGARSRLSCFFELERELGRV